MESKDGRATKRLRLEQKGSKENSNEDSFRSWNKEMKDSPETSTPCFEVHASKRTRGWKIGNKRRFNLIFVIEDFCNRFPNKDVASSWTSSGNFGDMLWCLFIDKSPENGEMVCLDLTDGVEKTKMLTSWHKLSIVDESNERLFPPNPAWVETKFGFEGFIEKAELLNPQNKYINQDGTLRVMCEIRYCPNTLPPERLKEDVEKMFRHEKMADLIIKCRDGRDFCCSKFMLAARSPVFMDMFESGAVDNEVVMVDVNPEAVGQMLEYIHTDKAYSYRNETAVDVLKLADKYGLDRLKKMVEREMDLRISRENIDEMIRLAELYSLPLLKSGCEDYSIYSVKKTLNKSANSQPKKDKETSKDGLSTKKRRSKQSESKEANHSKSQYVSYVGSIKDSSPTSKK